MLGEEIDRRSRRNATRRAQRAAARGDVDALRTAQALGARTPRIVVRKRDGRYQCPHCLCELEPSVKGISHGKCKCSGCGCEAHL